MRKLPPKPSENLNVERAAVEGLEVEVCLITRLYGGGARVGQIDERSWIRPPAFKAALRFWWRAGHAHLFKSLGELHQNEARLFGSPARFVKGEQGQQIAGGPGLVEVEVENALPSNLIVASFQPKFDKSLEGDALNVAYFPASLDDKAEGAQKLAQPEGSRKVRALLRIRWSQTARPQDIEQIRDALRLFLVLGGLGSRTRRGAGALAVTQEAQAKALSIPTSVAELDTFLRRFLKAGSVTSKVTGIWALAAAKMAWRSPGHKLCQSGEEGQRLLLETLRELRQDRPHPKDWKGPRNWGQSRWPEGDAIRIKATPNTRIPTNWRHKPNPENANKYPRAALGLPIVVKFKDEGVGQDPAKHTISAALPPKHSRLNRFASPLLLRPVRIWVEGQPRYLPVAVLGPLTLPPDAIALVELENNPRGEEIQDQDLVPEYRIVERAGNMIYDRVRTEFDKKLQKLT